MLPPLSAILLSLAIPSAPLGRLLSENPDFLCPPARDLVTNVPVDAVVAGACLNLTGVASNINLFAGSNLSTEAVAFRVQDGTGSSLEKLFFGSSQFNAPVQITGKPSTVKSMFDSTPTFNSSIQMDTSEVLYMEKMFSVDFPDVCSYNQPIDWMNTSSARTFDTMFGGCLYFNQPVEHLDLSQATRTRSMFIRTRDFNQPVNFGDLRKVSDMRWMFGYLHQDSQFNQPVRFTTSNALTTINGMFRNARRFNSAFHLTDSSGVVDMAHVFNGAVAFDQPLDLDTSSGKRRPK